MHFRNESGRESMWGGWLCVHAFFPYDILHRIVFSAWCQAFASYVQYFNCKAEPIIPLGFQLAPPPLAKLSTHYERAFFRTRRNALFVQCAKKRLRLCAYVGGK